MPSTSSAVNICCSTRVWSFPWYSCGIPLVTPEFPPAALGLFQTLPPAGSDPGAFPSRSAGFEDIGVARLGMFMFITLAFFTSGLIAASLTAAFLVEDWTAWMTSLVRDEAFTVSGSLSNFRFLLSRASYDFSFKLEDGEVKDADEEEPPPAELDGEARAEPAPAAPAAPLFCWAASFFAFSCAYLFLSASSGFTVCPSLF
mmetsp:Transcript_50390/g.157372  ORF Transcript_50390/g.157372 Transcript_50390/m.157372 type:complete len:201 (+) Transcript_50390:6938-7540(+)